MNLKINEICIKVYFYLKKEAKNGIVTQPKTAMELNKSN